MPRQAYLMKLHPGCEAEYKRRHDAIWPELARELKAAGISNFSIYLDPNSLTLFAVREVADPKALQTLPTLPIVKKWWAYMKDIMDTNPDNSPVELRLEAMFHLP